VRKILNVVFRLKEIILYRGGVKVRQVSDANHTKDNEIKDKKSRDNISIDLEITRIL
jgi:hypothetical protein